jgi:hypothetical protein
MELPDDVISKRTELVSVANAMLDGKMDLIEGVRRVCSLRFAIADPDNDMFLSFRAIESETDHFPLGEMRSRCATDFLQRMDADMKYYLSDAKQDILNGCKEIIRILS